MGRLSRLPAPETDDPHARRYQHTELRPFAGHVTEYRRHAVLCPCCGYKTRAAYDPDVVPRSAFGPRLMAVVVMLTGVYHLSRRKAATLMWELLGVRISTGAISLIEQRMSKALAPPADEAWEHAQMARVKHADGTTWLRAGATLALWTIATAAVTVFKVLGDGQGATLRNKLFVTVRGILVSDRATALKFWAMARRQVCWAHLARKFLSFSESDGPAAALGQQLVDYTGLIFRYWSDYRDGRLSRAQLRAWMAPVRAQLEAALERAVALGARGMSGSCADILEHRAALWTFIDRDGVEPTNNHAERELRAFVLRPVAKALFRCAERPRRSLRRARDDHRAHRAQAGPRHPRLLHRVLRCVAHGTARAFTARGLIIVTEATAGSTACGGAGQRSGSALLA